MSECCRAGGAGQGPQSLHRYLARGFFVFLFFLSWGKILQSIKFTTITIFKCTFIH